MANITELIKNIRNAILGKEVRESIAGAIEQCYEDAAKGENANMEVIDARGTFSTLRKRLDNSDDSINGLNGSLNQLSSNANTRIDSLQNQINGLILNNGSAESTLPEVVQARTSINSHTFTTLNERLSFMENLLPFNYRNVNNCNFNEMLTPRKIYGDFKFK